MALDAVLIGELLEKQKKVHGDLLELSHEKGQVIVRGEMDRLNEIVALEMKCLARLSALEKRRNKLLEEISSVLNVREEDLTLSVIIENVEPDERGALSALQKELMSAMKMLAEVNSRNGELLETHIEYSGAMINLFAQPEDPLNNLYGSLGKTDDDRRSGAGFFDQQA